MAAHEFGIESKINNDNSSDGDVIVRSIWRRQDTDFDWISLNLTAFRNRPRAISTAPETRFYVAKQSISWDIPMEGPTYLPLFKRREFALPFCSPCIRIENERNMEYTYTQCMYVYAYLLRAIIFYFMLSHKAELLLQRNRFVSYMETGKRDGCATSLVYLEFVPRINYRNVIESDSFQIVSCQLELPSWNTVYYRSKLASECRYIYFLDWFLLT